MALNARFFFYQAYFKQPKSVNVHGDVVPRYDYECVNCNHVFELKQSFDDESIASCPSCDGETRRLIHSVPVVFKGSGFYVNDYGKGKAGGNTPTSDSATPTDSKPKSDNETKTDDKSKESSPAKAEPTSKVAGDD